MSEYKTYKCDRCSALDAIHLTFNNVDEYGPDPADGKYYDSPGYVDLCRKCLETYFKNTVSKIFDRSSQRLLWRGLHGKF